jgi:hypothetical protein
MIRRSVLVRARRAPASPAHVVRARQLIDEWLDMGAWFVRRAKDPFASAAVGYYLCALDLATSARIPFPVSRSFGDWCKSVRR